VCHGYGQLASRFLERFRPPLKQSVAACRAEGLSRFYLTRVRRGTGRRELDDARRRLHEIDDYVRYLDGVYGKVVTRDARVTALGFSQGTATVCRWPRSGRRASIAWSSGVGRCRPTWT